MICYGESVELARGDFGLFSETTITPAIFNVVEALDCERLALFKALELDTVPLVQEFHRQGLTEHVMPLAS